MSIFFKHVKQGTPVLIWQYLGILSFIISAESQMNSYKNIS